MPRALQLAREFSALEQTLEELFSFLGDLFAAHRVDDATAFKVSLAAEELFTNMVRHNVGGRDSICLEVEITGDQIGLRLIDEDVEPFDAADVPAPNLDLPAEERRPGGLGLHLVRSVVDQITYDYEDRRLTVSVVKRLAAPDV